MDDLEILGPIPTFRVKFKSDGFKRPMVGELWLYPDGSQVIELSTKTTREAFQTGLEWRAFLESKRIDVSGSSRRDQDRPAVLQRATSPVHLPEVEKCW